jgi:hypothetical protein
VVSSLPSYSRRAACGHVSAHSLSFDNLLDPS